MISMLNCKELHVVIFDDFLSYAHPASLRIPLVMCIPPFMKLESRLSDQKRCGKPWKTHGSGK
jgi:hypothetical protein